MWCVYFRNGHERTHFALVHAGGQVLGSNAATAVVASDAAVKGTLDTLTRLAARARAEPSQPDVQSAREEYFKYLAREFGSITPESLPVDQEVGSRGPPAAPIC